ncbi:MAG TPA: alpha-1,2-fucosyltransferase [Candidatus Caccoplasma merdavium]|nr:alpha-1,2-fucosyltransferase [Candidatus Caccoplasma merdavium]
MLVVKLSDQLGNQMFAYASVKSIALDKGFEFGVYNEYDNQFLKNDTDKKFGNTLTSIFPQIRKEVVSDVQNYSVFQEITDSHSISSIQKEAYEVSDNTLMRGHYISPKYFLHRIDEVREWFAFPSDIQNKAENELTKIKAQFAPNTKFCSIHFRNALDYRVKGFMLNKNYWYHAANKILKNNEENGSIVFLIFYDKLTPLVKSFSKRYTSVLTHNSLLVDFEMISLCDYHIVCNSSFSIMAALMDPNTEFNTLCPSTYPIPSGYFPSDCYLSNWIKIKSHKDTLSHLCSYLAPLLSRFKHLIKQNR